MNSKKLTTKILSVLLALCIIGAAIPGIIFADPLFESPTFVFRLGSVQIADRITVTDGLTPAIPDGAPLEASWVVDEIPYEVGVAVAPYLNESNLIYVDAVMPETPAPETPPENLQETHTITYWFTTGETAYTETKQVLSGSCAAYPDTDPNTTIPAGMVKFSGWFTDAEGSAVFDFTQPVTSDIDVYAQYRDKYLVSYKNQDGIVVGTVLVSPEQDAGDVPESVRIVADEGSVFQGVWLNEATMMVYDFSNPVTDDIYLLPQIINGCYVTFVTQGESVPPQAIAAGGKATKPADPIRLGYSLTHWSATENGAPYNFNSTVTSNLTLHAVWKAQKVTYKIVVWRENIGIPVENTAALNNNQNYSYCYTVPASMAVAAGTELSFDSLNSLAASIAANTTNAAWNSATKVRNELGKAIPYSQFHHATTTVIQGDGLTVVNVYYSRTIYTLSFALGNGRMTIGTDTYTNTNRYSFQAKHEMDITGLWPLNNENNTKITLNKSYFKGWSIPGQSATQVSRVFTLTANLIPSSGTSSTITAVWVSSQATVTLNYMIETLNGEEPGSVLYGGKYYHRDSILSQNVVTDSVANYSLKTINGLKGVTSSALKLSNGNYVSNSNPVSSVQYLFYDRNVYSVSFDVNGGVKGSGSDYEISLKYGAAIKAPVNDPTREGYAFTGWYYDANGTQKVAAFNSSLTVPTSDVKFFAGWMPTAVSAYFYYANNNLYELYQRTGAAVGGTFPKPTNLEPGDALEGRGIFKGWYWYEPTTNIYQPFPFSLGASKDIKVFGEWITDSLTISYDLQGGSATKNSETSAIVDSNTYDLDTKALVLGEEFNITPPADRPNTVFAGWTLDNTNEVLYPGNILSVYSNHILYARYLSNHNVQTITYHANGGVNGSTASNIKHSYSFGSTAQVSSMSLGYAKTGYTFLGWAITPDGEVEYAKDVINTVPMNKNYDLYAVWEKLVFTVTYLSDENGKLATTAVSTVTADYGKALSSLAFPDTVPNTNYYFDHWSLFMGGVSSDIPADMLITTNITLIAHHRAKTDLVLALSTEGANTVVYDASVHTLTGVITGVPANLTLTGVTAQVSGKDVGEYALKLTVASEGARLLDAEGKDVTALYNIKLPTVAETDKLTITPYTVTLTAEDKTVPFGTQPGNISYSHLYGSFPAGESISNLIAAGFNENSVSYATDPAYTAVTSADSVLNIQLKVASPNNPNLLFGNYKLALVSGKLTVSASANLNASATGYEGFYDGKAHNISVHPNLNGATVLYSLTQNGTYVTESQLESAIRTNVTDSASGAANSITVYYQVSLANYTTVTGSATLRIKHAPLSAVVTGPNTIVYGSALALSSYTGTISGYVNNETDAVLKGNYTTTTDYARGAAAGSTFTVSMNGPAYDGNYALNYTPALGTVVNASFVEGVDFVVNSYDGLYDGAAHSISTTINATNVTPLVEYRLSGASGAWVTDPSQLGATNVTRSLSGAQSAVVVDVRISASNYNTAEIKGSITIRPVPLTASVADAPTSVPFLSDLDPTDYAVNITGYITGEDAGNLASPLYVSTNYVKGSLPSAVPVYNLIPAGEAQNGNYAITFVPSLFTVTKATITGADVQATGYTGLYDAMEHGITVDVSALAAIGIPAVEYRLAGTDLWLNDAQFITVLRNESGAVLGREVEYKVSMENFNDFLGSAFVRINPVPVTIRALDATMVLGDPVPQLFAAVTGAVNNERIEYTTALDPNADLTVAGNVSIIPGLGINAAGLLNNYDVTFLNGNLTITDLPPVEQPPETPGDPNPPIYPPQETNPPIIPVPPGLENLVPENDPVFWIGDNALPLVGNNTQLYWSLLNLMVAISGILLALVHFFRASFVKRQQNSGEGYEYRPFRYIALLAGLMLPVLFLLTENIRNTVALIDQWTPVVLILFAVEILFLALPRKNRSRGEKV